MKFAYLNMGLRLLLEHLEGEVLDIALNSLVGPLSADQTLGVEHGVLGVGGQLILGGISDQSKQYLQINYNI